MFAAGMLSRLSQVTLYSLPTTRGDLGRVIVSLRGLTVAWMGEKVVVRGRWWWWCVGVRERRRRRRMKGICVCMYVCGCVKDR